MIVSIQQPHDHQEEATRNTGGYPAQMSSSTLGITRLLVLTHITVDYPADVPWLLGIQLWRCPVKVAWPAHQSMLPGTDHLGFDVLNLCGTHHT